MNNIASLKWLTRVTAMLSLALTCYELIVTSDTLSHFLHINDAFISSLLYGFMVLLISPVHHKLQAFLNNKFKRKTPEVHH